MKEATTAEKGSASEEFDKNMSAKLARDESNY